MEKITTLARTFFTMMLAITLFSSCSKTAAEAPTDEQIGPKETVALPMYDVNSTQVGSVYIDKMNSGRAQARVSLYDGYYSSATMLKTNATVTTSNGSNVFATCTDVDGKTGKCSTFPIKKSADNSDATFSDVTGTNGLVFNVLDNNGNILYRTAKYVVILHQ